MKTENKPFYGIIAATGTRFTVQFVPINGCDANLQGYSIDTIKQFEEDFPVIDFRSASAKDILNLVMRNNPPRTESELLEYLTNARLIGATVTRKKLLA